MDDMISRKEVLILLNDWIDYYDGVINKCKELNAERTPSFTKAKDSINLLAHLISEIEEL